MKERDIQGLFGKWLQAHPRPESAAYELKLVKGNAVLFKAVREHQVTALLAVKNGGIYHKIADQTIGRNNTFGWTLKKPFDCLWLSTPRSYVVPVFYKPREYKMAFFIDIDDWIKEENASKRKSLTMPRAQEIALFKALL